MAAASRPLELRRTSRVRLGQPVTFSFVKQPGVSLQGTAKDISIGGMFIETSVRCPQGEQLVVYMSLPGRDRVMTLPGVVRWAASGGMGLQFGLLGARETYEIAAFVLNPDKVPSSPVARPDQQSATSATFRVPMPAAPPVEVRSPPRVTRGELLAFLRRHRLCVQASASSSGVPQAAVVGFAVSDDLEIVFDTIGTTRKMQNLRSSGRIALVVGWDAEQTVQIEGIADEPKGAELDRLKQVYFSAWPDGVDRQSWKDITYVRVRPTWARYSDFRAGGPIVELGEAELRGEGA
jgi:hypothetical protein